MFMLIIQALTVLGSIIAAVLAWAAKLRWSEEFKKAKEAQIHSLVSQIAVLKASQEENLKAKEAQIHSLVSQIDILQATQVESIKAKEAQISTLREQLKSLQDMNSEKTKEFFEFTKSQLEAYNDELGLRVSELEDSIQDKEELISSLSAHQTENHQKIEELENQKRTLENRLSEIEIEKKNLDTAIVTVKDTSAEKIEFGKSNERSSLGAAAVASVISPTISPSAISAAMLRTSLPLAVLVASELAKKTLADKDKE